MKKTAKTEWLQLVVLALPFVYLLFTWNNFPEKVPIHFNAEGQPDKFAGKAVGLLLLPVLNLILYWVLKYIPRIDPRRENYALFEGRYNNIRLALNLFLVFIFFLVTSAAISGSGLQPKLLLIGLALLIMAIGNYMSAVRPNFFVGIRTPWTLSNEEVWRKTHRMAGWLWVAASLLLIAAVLILDNVGPILIFGYTGILIIPPIVYSYLLFRKTNQHKTA